MEDWKKSRLELVGLAEDILILSAEFRLVCKACKCHLPPDKNGVVGHLAGKKHRKSLVKFNERKINYATTDTTKSKVKIRPQAQTWYICRKDDQLPADLASAEVAVPFVGSTLVKAGCVWNEDETVIDKNALRDLICGIDDVDVYMDSLWEDEEEETIEIIEEGSLARFGGFNRHHADNDNDDVRISKIDTFTRIIPQETPHRRISQSVLRPIREFKYNHAPSHPYPVVDPVVLNENEAGTKSSLDTDNHALPAAAEEIEGNKKPIDSDDVSIGAPWLHGKPKDIVVGDDVDDDDDDRHFLALHCEIVAFERYISPTEDEKLVREKAVETMRYITQSVWPGSAIHLYGSYANGIDLPTGDLDMCVVGTPDVDENGETVTEAALLKTLARQVRKLSAIFKWVQVAYARVPVLKLVFRQGNVHCDICVKHPAVLVSVKTIRTYLDRFPALRPLTLVLKFFLAQKGLNDAHTGGLPSFAIFLLCLSHLQMYSRNFPDNDTSGNNNIIINSNLGTVLLNFFYFYGYMFNCCTTGIDVRKCAYYKREHVYGIREIEHWQRFSIMDPNDPDNEIGLSTHACRKIILAFRRAYAILTDDNQTETCASDNQPSLLAKILFDAGNLLQFGDDEQVGNTYGDVA